MDIVLRDGGALPVLECGPLVRFSEESWAENQADVERDDLNLKKAVHSFPFKEFQVFSLIPSLCVLPVFRGGRETEFNYGRAED